MKRKFQWATDLVEIQKKRFPERCQGFPQARRWMQLAGCDWERITSGCRDRGSLYLLFPRSVLIIAAISPRNRVSPLGKLGLRLPRTMGISGGDPRRRCRRSTWQRSPLRLASFSTAISQSPADSAATSADSFYRVIRGARASAMLDHWR